MGEKENEEEEVGANRAVAPSVIAARYVDPGHPTAFSSPGAVYRYYEGRVPMSTVVKALESVDAYTKHKETKRPATFNPFYSYQRRTEYQADLVDMSGIKAANSYYAYLLVVIDVFSRKLWVMPLKTKSAASMREALRHWLVDQDSEPGASQRLGRRLYTDRGKEFVARSVVELLKEFNFKHTTSKRGLYKAAVAERVNKTLQVRIYRYLSHTGRLRYVDVLPDIIGAYNNTKHSTLEHAFSPEEADDPENEDRVREIHGRRYHDVMQKMKRTRKKRRFKIGDTVRVTLSKGRKVGPEGRAYTPFFSDELFQVVRVGRRMPVPRIYLRSLLTMKPVPGSFYANELSKHVSSMFKVEKVLGTKTEGGDRLKLVKLKGLHSGFNTWVKEEHIDANKRVRIGRISASLDEGGDTTDDNADEDGGQDGLD